MKEAVCDAELEGDGLVFLVVVSTPVLCEDTDVLSDSVVDNRVVEWSVDADSLSEDFWDVTAVSVDVVLEFDEVGEGFIDENSLPEGVEDIVEDDVILDFVVVDKDMVVDSWTFEEVEIFNNVVSRLGEERAWSVDDGLVSEKLEELVSADVDVVPIIFGVSEDKADDAWTIEDGRDVECVEVDSFSRSVEVVEDGRDMAGVVIDIVFELVEVVVRRVDDDLVPGSTEEVCGTNDSVILGSVDVDGSNVDSELETIEDVARAEVDFAPKSVEVVEGEFDDNRVGKDERDVAGVDFDVIS